MVDLERSGSLIALPLGEADSDILPLRSSDLIYAGESLHCAPIVEFTAMMKALLALQYLREVEPREDGALADEPLGPESRERARKLAAEHYDLLATHAIDFCNDPRRSIDLKAALREA